MTPADRAAPSSRKFPSMICNHFRQAVGELGTTFQFKTPSAFHVSQIFYPRLTVEIKVQCLGGELAN